MSVDKLVDSTQLDADLTSVANAIRTKGGTSAQLAFPSGFVSAINAIPTGGGTSDWTRVVVSAAATTAQACANALFTNRRAGYVYFAYLDQDETPVTLDYHLAAFCVMRDSTVGGGYRYRTSGTYNSFSGITTSVTAKIAVGDVFYVCEKQFKTV